MRGVGGGGQGRRRGVGGSGGSGPLSWNGECIFGVCGSGGRGGVWPVNFCQPLRCVWHFLHGRGGVGWRGGWGGRGRQGGINLIKDTNAEPHWESKKKERG